MGDMSIVGGYYNWGIIIYRLTEVSLRSRESQPFFFKIDYNKLNNYVIFVLTNSQVAVSLIYRGSNPTRNGDRTDDRFESCPDYK